MLIAECRGGLRLALIQPIIIAALVSQTEPIGQLLLAMRSPSPNCIPLQALHLSTSLYMYVPGSIVFLDGYFVVVSGRRWRLQLRRSSRTMKSGRDMEQTIRPCKRIGLRQNMIAVGR